MKSVIRHLILSALLLLSVAGTASAQYIWMDSNGDGVFTAADVMNANGTPTTVDVWINTAHNKDGSLAACNSADGDLATWNSYAMHINTVNGQATFTSFVNQQAAFTTACVGVGVFFATNNTTQMAACAATGAPTPNGGVNLKMFTITVTGTSGTPSLQFVSTNSLDQNFTSFGTPCSGNDFDNTYKLGSDFTDNDGLGAAAGGNASPMLNAPTTATGTEGQAFTVTANATDADAADVLTMSASGQPASLTLTTSPHVSPNSATLSGTFGFSDQGSYPIVWSVNDGHNPTVNATTNLTVNNTDRAPTVSAPATASGNENTLITFTATASDPDGDAILAFAAAPLPTGATFTSNAGHTSGTFSWTPTFTQAGSYSVTFTANNALSGSATTAITVNNVDRAPTVTAPATASGNENTLIQFTVSASDPDGDAITSLTQTPPIGGASFVTNGANTSGTFVWTPDFTQAGTYNVTVTAANALSGSATTVVTVNNVDRAPVLSAPPTETVASNSLLSFTVGASDPDGDAITSLTAAPLPTGASFTANGTHTIGTFSWTPTNAQVGTTTVTFTASNALTGTASTAITVTSGDHPPAVTAPATASGNENTLITFTVSASDPDADPITSLTASGTAITAGGTFTANGTNTSGTFNWTPTFTQAGSYAATFTASNVLSGSATTNITVNNVDRAPTVTAPATASGNENTLITFTVSASDPDADPITSLTGTPLPTGASFTANGSHTSGTFSWTPTFTQAGSYSVTFTAANALTGTATTAITVNNVDRAPAVTAPSTVTGASGDPMSFTVTASDPDGDAIASLTAISLPGSSTFTANGTNTSGTFNWTPGVPDIGSHDVTFTASNALSGAATTHITVTNGDHPPVVTAPATASGDENTNIHFTVSATDPDGDAITSLTAAPLPTGASFTAGAGNTTGTFDWTPSFSQAGAYNVTFTASNALSGSATTAITVNNVDRAPTVTAPATASGNEGTLITFTVSASDPDGDAITSLAGAPLPTGASFTANGSNTSGTFNWTPSFSQAGSYSVTFTASNALSGSASTDITVNNVDQAPVVTAPATRSVAEGANLNFTVSASDPDGDAIGSLTAAGTAITAGATFTADGTNTTGTFDWTPTSGQAGSYSVTFTASNALSGSATTAITVTGVNHDPVVTAPASETTDEGVLLTFAVTATDQDGNHVTLSAVGLPAGASFTDNNDNTGTFSWMPGFNQSGLYTVTFVGNDGNGGTGSATTMITVNNVNRAPTANAGGPYTGVVNVAVSFDGSGSSDPDGDTLTYGWDFGDASTGTGVNPSHTYTAAATYTVTLTVTDPGLLSGTATTTATISSTFPATAFTVGGNKTTSLGSGKPFTCIQVQPDGGAYSNADVNLASIRMTYPVGSANSILADPSKTAIDSDKNSDGIQEIAACFKKADLRTLFTGLPAGRNSVTVSISGDLVTGGRFNATLIIIVKSTGALVASVSPNPLNPQAKLTFATSKPGAIRVQMFDAQGRLVKTIADESAAQAGYHDYTIDGRSSAGAQLASGVYFVKIWAQSDGNEVTRITIMK